MKIQLEGFEFIIDPETDFIMLSGCYRNGCNCCTCMEREFDGCPIDEVDIEYLIKHGDIINE